MLENRSKSYLERFLNIFTEVKAGEGVSALLLFVNLFLLLTSYYIIKPVREALILAGGGAEVKSYAAAGQAILLLGVVPLYGWLASRFPRKPLINIVTLFFTGCLVVFYILAQFNVPLGVVFYLWVGIFNLMVIAQFWSFANDLYTPEDGKRIFVIVAFGASSGAVFGSYITGRLIGVLGVYQLLLLSGALLLISLLLTNLVDKRQKNTVQLNDEIKQVIVEPLKKGNGFGLVLKNKYLLLIAFLLLFLNWVNTTGEYILGRTVTEAASKMITDPGSGDMVKEYIGKFYADFFTIVNIAGLIIQLFLVSRILKYIGIRVALLVLPFIALGGYFIMAFYPVLMFVKWAKIFENSTDYSLQNTVRQVLFLPTTREEKYNAKQAIDTFFVRAGDVLSALVVYLGTNFLAFHTKQFALFNIALVTIWIIIAIAIGIENKKRVASFNQ